MNSMTIVYSFVSHPPSARMLITDTILQCVVGGRYEGPADLYFES